MGGDYGCEVMVPAAVEFLKSRSDSQVILVGDSARISGLLARAPARIRERCQARHADQVVAMDENPAKALRGKRDSSMRVAIEAVKSGDAEACVSAGNTGALLAIARFVLKTLPEIDRPAITRPFFNARSCVR